MMLAILGEVFDVTKGKQHYGEGRPARQALRVLWCRACGHGTAHTCARGPAHMCTCTHAHVHTHTHTHRAGPNSGYSGFIGKDATRAFVTGALVTRAPRAHVAYLEPSYSYSSNLLLSNIMHSCVAIEASNACWLPPPPHPGDFTADGLTDNVAGLTPEQCASLLTWRNFYRQHKVRAACRVLALCLKHSDHCDEWLKCYVT